ASVVDMIPSASLSLMYGEDRKIAAEKILPNPDTRPLIELQTLTIEREFYELGQPFTLLLEQKMGLYSNHLQLMVLLSFLIFGGYGLLYRVRFSKYGLKLQRDAAVLELAQQHSHLETMVAQRTRELQRKSDENKRQSQQLIRVQEDQYHHIARELHDEFGQTLTAIKINAHILENTETVAGVSIYAQEITPQADALYETMRDLIQRLRPEALDMFGLKVALEQCLLAFRLHEQNVELQLVIDDAVSDMAEIYTITSYRIVQELVNNAVKYSQQTQLKVELVVNDDGLNICVVDDGIGFDPLQSKVGFGLSSVEERVRSLGGYVDIKTEANKGVNVCIQIPLQELKGKPVN
ncbi:MAG: histidine kinase, partial [Oceanospirillaceae bacterium]|nr:histidine kinase [Oceanospirillaceae bacterium]